LKLLTTLEIEDELEDKKETTIDDTKNKCKKIKNMAGLKIKVFSFILFSFYIKTCAVPLALTKIPDLPQLLFNIKNYSLNLPTYY